MSLTYEEMYEKYYRLTRQECGKHRFMTDKEDVLQELWLDIYMKLEKINNKLEEVEHPAGYINKYAKYFFLDYIEEEHKKGLWLINHSYTDFIDIFENDGKMNIGVKTSINKKGEVVVIDNYIKEHNERDNENAKKRRERMKTDPNKAEQYQKYLDIRRNYYKKHKEQWTTYMHNKKNKLEYMKENEPEKYREYCDIRNAKRREARRKKKAEKQNNA